MRFETDVLTLTSPGEYRGPHRTHWFTNTACRSGITKRGWKLPDSIGSRVVLVFSTERVAGASTVRGYELYYAARVACRKSQPDIKWDAHLWWWPEIVEGK